MRGWSFAETADMISMVYYTSRHVLRRMMDVLPVLDKDRIQLAIQNSQCKFNTPMVIPPMISNDADNK
jgi:hypothetical protein